MSTMTDETYNGYKNRETWAFNLHWQNDQGLYNFVLEYARGALEELDTRAYSDGGAYAVGYRVVEYVREELPELSPTLWESMREDVGSWWRIDESEVGAAVLESLDVEGVDADTDDE